MRYSFVDLAFSQDKNKELTADLGSPGSTDKLKGGGWS